MTISRIELQGQITRAQDFTTIKQQEDSKGYLDQTGIQHQLDRQEEVKSRQVQQKDQTDNEGRRFDARDQGNGEYQGDGGRDRKKKKQPDGKVIVKGRSSFDIKI